MRCPNCRASMKTQVLAEHDLTDLFGVNGVVVRNLPAMVCPSCGDLVIGGPVLEVLSEALFAQMLHGSFALFGAEVRFLRKAIGFTQVQLSELVGVDRVTVARWETSADRLAMPESIAIRAVIAANVKGGAEEMPRDGLRKPPAPRPSRFELEAPPASGM